MNLIKSLFAIIGFGVVFFAALGSFGIGNFVLLYSHEKITVIEGENDPIVVGKDYKEKNPTKIDE